MLAWTEKGLESTANNLLDNGYIPNDIAIVRKWWDTVRNGAEGGRLPLEHSQIEAHIDTALTWEKGGLGEKPIGLKGLPSMRAYENKDRRSALNKAYSDRNLSWEAIGVLAYLTLNFKDRAFGSSDIMKQEPERKEEFKRGLDELAQHGYLEISWRLVEPS